MEILEFRVPSSYELILFGDNQEGNALQYKKGYRECIEYILADRHRFGIHFGDDMEAYWIDDPRYDPYILQSTPLEQQEQVINDLRPIADTEQLIALIYGNHAHRLSAKVGNIVKSTCKQLKIRYGGFSNTITFVDDYGSQFKGYFSHGKKPIRSIADDPVRRTANEKLQLKQHLKNKVGDCVLMAKGHTHRLIVSEPLTQLYLTTEMGAETKIKQNYTHNPSFGKGGYVHPDHRWYVNTGSFLRTFGEGLIGYSEMGEYDPVELGYAVVEVNDRQITNIRKVVV